MSPLGQTPPRPADPTPCSLLPGARARAGTRSEVGGRRRVRAASRVGEARAEAARRAVVSGQRGPLLRRPPAGPSRVSGRQSGPWAPKLDPRSGLRGTPPGERSAPFLAVAVAQRAGGGMRRGERAARAPRARGRLWPVLAVLAAAAGCVRAAMDECADEGGRAQRCMPEFVNAAFNVTVVATNTCGTPPEEYCVQTGVTGVTKSCHLCDAGQPHLQHGAAFLTDYNNQADTTWWQSQTMLAGVQYPNAINLTLHLGKR